MYIDVYCFGGDFVARTRTNMFLDNEFKEFLEHLKEKTGTPISRILELATMEKYKDEYQKFIESKERASNKG